MRSSENPFCPTEMTSTEFGDYTWPPTNAGTTAQIMCELGAIDDNNDSAFRRCNDQGSWIGVDGTNCRSLYDMFVSVSLLHK